jgi:hypothetical protein
MVKQKLHLAIVSKTKWSKTRERDSLLENGFEFREPTIAPWSFVAQ